MTPKRKLSKPQQEFFEPLPISVIAECYAELLTYEEAFGDCTISEAISIIHEEVERQRRETLDAKEAE